MKYALELPAAGATADPKVLGQLALVAEESGWDGVFLEDYLVHHSGLPTCDPLIALAAMALATERLMLGTEVTPVSRLRPWKLARELASLDLLSEGRIVLGVGLGDLNDAAWAAVGEISDTRTRADLMDESLAILAGLWTGEPFRFEGRHYRIEEVTFRPVPVQRPRIPIWIGGGWPNRGVKRRAPRWDGCCAYMEMGTFEEWGDQTPEYVRELLALVEAERGTSKGYDVVTGGRPRDDDEASDKAIIASLENAGATWWVEYVEAEADLETTRAAVARGPLR
jgi:alkanesulfonate monooxygenase SsuD/methylene tetrahydromethanopterin reductase-like flavin-dependent oxidoreductase (luciferase family)